MGLCRPATVCSRGPENACGRYSRYAKSGIFAAKAQQTDQPARSNQLTNETQLNLYSASDPRLAALATSSQPAWLWQADGARIVWANAAGARVFGIAEQHCGEKIFGPADQHRRQIAQLTSQLNPDGAVRMERLRGFGAAPGMLATSPVRGSNFPMAVTACLWLQQALRSAQGDGSETRCARAA